MCVWENVRRGISWVILAFSNTCSWSPFPAARVSAPLSPGHGQARNPGGVVVGGGAIISFHSVRGHIASTPPQGTRRVGLTPLKPLCRQKTKLFQWRNWHWLTLVPAGNWQESQFLQMNSGCCGPWNGLEPSVIHNLRIWMWHLREQELCRNFIFTCDFSATLRIARGQRSSK